MDIFWYANDHFAALANFSSLFMLAIALVWLFREKNGYSFIAFLLGLTASTSTLLRFYIPEVKSVKSALVPADDQNPLIFWLYLYAHEVCLVFFFIVLLSYFARKRSTITKNTAATPQKSR